MNSKKTVRFGIIGSSSITDSMLAGAAIYPKLQLCAVCSRTAQRAEAYAEKHGAKHTFTSPAEMAKSDTIDMVYIASPNRLHMQQATLFLQNGKHVLCEKSVMLNSRELAEAIALAEEHHVVFAEAMTIWHMPLYKKLWQIVETGDGEIPALGKVQFIQLNFGSYKEYNMKNRFFNMNLAGGALLDIGVYALSIARSFMSSQPDQVLSQVKYAPTGADEQEGILLMNPDGQMAALSLSLHSKQPKRAVISCEKGYIEIMEYPRADRAIVVEAETGKVHEITAGTTADALLYEMTDMEDAILNGNTGVMRLKDTRDVMELMTGLRKEWNMKYPGEEW